MSFIKVVQADLKRYPRKSGVAPFLVFLIFNRGFQCCLALRLQRYAARLPIIGKIIKRVLWYITNTWFAIDISPDASLGAGLYIPHPLGIVIGDNAKIGNNVTILQGVTIGRSLRTKAEYPTIEDGVEIYAGAVIVGKVTVGSHSIIGANCVVIKNIPENALAVGAPARVVRKITSNGI